MVPPIHHYTALHCKVCFMLILSLTKYLLESRTNCLNLLKFHLLRGGGAITTTDKNLRKGGGGPHYTTLHCNVCFMLATVCYQPFSSLVGPREIEKRVFLSTLCLHERDFFLNVS